MMSFEDIIININRIKRNIEEIDYLKYGVFGSKDNLYYICMSLKIIMNVLDSLCTNVEFLNNRSKLFLVYPKEIVDIEEGI